MSDYDKDHAADTDEISIDRHEDGAELADALRLIEAERTPEERRRIAAWRKDDEQGKEID